jgi:hypothetical protein
MFDLGQPRQIFLWERWRPRRLGGEKEAGLYLAVDSAEAADTIYAALAEGGEVSMPIESTFFASRFAQLRGGPGREDHRPFGAVPPAYPRTPLSRLQPPRALLCCNRDPRGPRGRRGSGGRTGER